MFDVALSAVGGGLVASMLVWFLQLRQARAGDRRVVTVMLGELRMLLNLIQASIEAYEDPRSPAGRHGEDNARRQRLYSPALKMLIEEEIEHHRLDRTRLAAVRDDNARRLLQEILRFKLPPILERLDTNERYRRGEAGAGFSPSFVPDPDAFRAVAADLQEIITALESQGEPSLIEKHLRL